MAPRPAARPTRLRQGFTLVELIVAMAIIAILATITAIQLRRGEQRERLWAAADELEGLWQEMQARSLAGLPIPPDTPMISVYGGEPLSPPPAEAEGYGVLLFGPNWSDIYWSRLHDLSPHWNAIDGYLYMAACSIPQRPFIENLPFNPDFGYPITPNFDIYRGTCYFPLRGLSPILPSDILILPATVEVGSSTESLFPLLGQSHPNSPYGYRLSNYESCDPNMADDIPPTIRSAVFISIYPPQPTFYVNGYSGCKILQFAMTTPNDLNQRLWVRFDLNTGRMSVTPTRPD